MWVTKSPIKGRVRERKNAVPYNFLLHDELSHHDSRMNVTTEEIDTGRSGSSKTIGGRSRSENKVPLEYGSGAR